MAEEEAVYVNSELFFYHLREGDLKTIDLVVLSALGVLADTPAPLICRLTGREIAESVGRHPGTISRSIDRLCALDFVISEAAGYRLSGKIIRKGA